MRTINHFFSCFSTAIIKLGTWEEKHLLCAINFGGNSYHFSTWKLKSFSFVDVRRKKGCIGWKNSSSSLDWEWHMRLLILSSKSWSEIKIATWKMLWELKSPASSSACSFYQILFAFFLTYTKITSDKNVFRRPIVKTTAHEHSLLFYWIFTVFYLRISCQMHQLLRAELGY